MKKSLLVIFAMVLMVISGMTDTIAITIDPDFLPGGVPTSNYQPIANSYSSLGVTMQMYDSGYLYPSNNTAVLAMDSTKASTGTKVFGGGDYFPYWVGPASGDTGTRLYFNFTSAASYISLDFIPYEPNKTYTSSYGTKPWHQGLLYVYDGNTLLQQIVVPNNPVNTVRVLAPHITRIVATAMGYPSLYHAPGWVALDNLQYQISSGGGMLLTLNNDTISTSGGFALGSQDTLRGTGTIQGDLGNSGMIDPGASPGKIIVNGVFSQNSTGKLKIELGGAGPGLFDFLDVNGNAILDGALEIGLINNFLPADGQSFKILEYNSHTGSFSNYLGLNFTGGHFELDYGPTGLNLISYLDTQLTGLEPIPEPATMLLLGSGLLGLVGFRKRFKK